ncbi:Divalent-cation tolerance protein CutA [Hyella patelloides LEGE 07179]|uniref:Divalent-cation tolerance protein CutA n=1 Tax=Hyella patelloides LEGE 07179 TaxID=945734 RepID=A0A563W244_9CYAN|nr:divalent-cation tolerance protein CutA [Hyella patelloides]VEP17751.1 Divalent-cation tolerance protein CutA [Hyella patelloides LEGE 07179]
MPDNNFEYGVVLTTVSSEEQGKAIAKSLLNEKLAACISIFPLQSLYTWQGEMNQDREWQLIIKTRLDLLSELKTKIQSLHDYEVPEIIALPIVDGSKSYLQWLGSNTTSDLSS